MSRNPLTAQNTSVLVQSRVLEARDAKVFGDMLTFYTFIFKFGAVRYEDVCLHIYIKRESASVSQTHTHKHTRGLFTYKTLTV